MKHFLGIPAHDVNIGTRATNSYNPNKNYFRNVDVHY